MLITEVTVCCWIVHVYQHAYVNFISPDHCSQIISYPRVSPRFSHLLHSSGFYGILFLLITRNRNSGFRFLWMAHHQDVQVLSVVAAGLLLHQSDSGCRIQNEKTIRSQYLFMWDTTFCLVSVINELMDVNC
jgi:hypothetical protein